MIKSALKKSVDQCFSTKGRKQLNKGSHGENVIKCVCTKNLFLNFYFKNKIHS